MQGDALVFSRRQLYEEIWATPVYEVAKRYGISNFALTRICQQLDIPRPSRRYWALLHSGRKGDRVALPALKDGQPEEYRLARRDTGAPAAGTAAMDTPAPASVEPPFELVVLPSLENPHRLVARALKEFRKATPDREGLVHADALPVAVGRGQVDRALRFLDALLKGLERAGHEVLPAESYEARHRFRIDGVEIEYSVRERLARTPHARVKDDIFPPNWDHKPSGDLRFKIEWDRKWRSQKQWEDRTRTKLEHWLNEIFAELLTLPARQRAVERERRAREEVQLQREQQRWQEQERFAEQKRKEEVVVAMAQRWKDSALVREFVASVREYAEQQFGTITPNSSAAHWLAFADGVADRLDPRPEMFGAGAAPKPQ